MPRSVTRLFFLLAAAFLSVLVVTAPAQGHAGITGVDPEPGTALDVLPDEVVFSFTEVLQEPSFASVTHNGDVVEDWQAQLDGERFIVTPPADAPDGAYVVAYRVVSADGHPIEGSTNFTVGTVSDDDADEAQTSADEPSEPADADDSGSLWSSPWLWGGILVIGVAALAATASRRPRGEDSQS